MEPVTLRAGDSASWSRTLPDYPASDGWTLAYRIIPPSGDPVEIPTTGSGDTHDVALVSGATANLPAGNCLLVGILTKAGGQQVTLYHGSITILPNLAALSSYDARSQARQALDKLREIYAAAQASGNALLAEYEIAGRRVKYKDTAQVLQQIRYFEQQVAAEDAAAALMNGTSRGRVQVRI